MLLNRCFLYIDVKQLIKRFDIWKSFRPVVIPFPAFSTKGLNQQQLEENNFLQIAFNSWQNNMHASYVTTAEATLCQ